MEIQPTEELLTVEDLAALLKVKVSWVYDRISPKHRERLPHIRLGRYIRFERSAVFEFIQRQRKGYLGPRCCETCCRCGRRDRTGRFRCRPGSGSRQSSARR